MKKILSELLVQCQNVQCGAKLMAEIHYIYKDNLMLYDEAYIDKQLNNWPDLKYIISYHSYEITGFGYDIGFYLR